MTRPNNSTNIFITGGSGFIGKQFILALLEDDPKVQIYALVRQRTMEGILKLPAAKSVPFNHPRVHMVPGDLTNTRVIDKSGVLPDTIDEFWHVAGTTDFNEEKRQRIFDINLEGTRNAIALAESLKAKRYYHTSTAYVAGIFDGVVHEDELLPHPVFRNPYEESKYLAEKLVRASKVVPWTILRPSIVMGNTETGEAESDKTVYGMVKLYKMLKQLVDREWRDRGGIPDDLTFKLKAKRESTKNIVAVNELVRLMLAVRNYGEEYKTYHLTATRISSMGELHDTFLRLINFPIITLSDDFTESEDPFQNFLNKNVDIYEPYLIYNDPEFDRTNCLQLPGNENSVQINKKELEFLFRKFIERKDREKASVKEEFHPGSLDLSRYEAVKKWGSGTLSFDSMARQFKTFTAEGINGYAPYIIYEGTALMVSDPISDQPEKLAKEFVNFCDQKGYSACAVQITEPIAGALRETGMVVNGFGIETYLDINQFDPEMNGKKYSLMRVYRNIAARNEIEIKEEPITPTFQAEMKAISAEWKNTKANTNQLMVLVRPATFETEPGVRSYSIRQRGKLLGYSLFSPMYRDNRIFGYYGSVGQYSKKTEIKGAFNFITHLVMIAMKDFRKEGVEYISLGLSPLYGLDRAKWNDKQEVKALLEKYYEESILYAFKGIADQKKRIPDTVEHTMYLAVQSGSATEDMLHLLNAIGFLG